MSSYLTEQRRHRVPKRTLVALCGPLAGLWRSVRRRGTAVPASNRGLAALWVLMVWLSWITERGAAQDLTEDLVQPASDRAWQWASYTADAGLANQRVFDLAFEKDGTVWLASSDGLRRFDGYEWESFGTHSGLPSSFTRAILITTHGELWVGSDAGAGVFDPVRKTYDRRGSEAGLASSNVRQIVEDPDGALWFACDQWPEVSGRKGGLTQLRAGRWTSYGRDQGLPVDYVIGYFRDRDGRQFAMTPQGWRERQGEAWILPRNPGYDAESSVLHMAQGLDGVLFAQGERIMLGLLEGQWRALATETVVVGTTLEGQAVAVLRDASRGQLTFGLWTGQGFARASQEIPAPPGVRLYRVRAAPDGSVWCVGYDTVLRWAYRSGPWVTYPNLPAPLTRDAQGRLWFSGESKVVVGDGGRLQVHPRLTQVLAVDRAGTALGYLEDGKSLAVTAPDEPLHCEPADLGLQSGLRCVTDGAGALWAVGRRADGGVGLARRDGNTWRLQAPGVLAGKQVMDVSGAPRGGLYVIARPEQSFEYELYRVTDDAVERQPLLPTPPPVTYPSFRAGAGWGWIQGYSGLYQADLERPGPWQLVTAFPDSGFETAATVEGEVLFHFTGGPSGRTGCALFHDGRWTVRYGQFYRVLAGREQRTFYLASRGGLYVRRQGGGLDLDLLPLPAPLFIGSVVSEPDGGLWLGTSEGALRYTGTAHLPRPAIQTAVTEVQSGATWPVRLSGVSRFAPAIPPEAFRYSWRFDDGYWSAYGTWPGHLLRVPDLPPGEHRLEVRLKDWEGRSGAQSAIQRFTVSAVPLQQRDWFKPLVVVLVLLIGYLAWLGLSRTREIARSNEALRREVEVRKRAEADLEGARLELEQRVAERTAELSRVNESLSVEVAERRQAEATRHQLEQQLRQSQKMEAVGTLAGGIAHDFNNILGIIIPYTHLALEDTQGQTPVQESLQQVLLASERARLLVRQILAFSRRQRQERRIIDLGPVVKETLKLLRSVLPTTLEITSQIGTFVPKVLADPTQIHQVLMNLCTNAEHAMRGRPGRLEISLEARPPNLAVAGERATGLPGASVRLMVRDNGCGMSPEVLERIYEPFFTTKGPGEGTGLGLAVVHGIITDHDGTVQVRSQVGEGTVFEIYLPARPEATEPEREPASAGARGRGERVLLVDDEPAIAEVLRRLLERCDFRVTMHTDPVAAWEAVQADPAGFDLVFTDLTMPGMTGFELARRIAQVRPNLPIVLATGFDGAVAAQAPESSGIRRVLLKPIDPKTISGALEEVLRAAPGTPAPDPG